MSGHQVPQPNLSQQSNGSEDLTWLDFILDPAPPDRPAPPERQASVDRKRRYTGPAQEGRSYPYPHNSGRWQQHTMSGNTVIPGSSRENAINLTSSPSPPLRHISNTSNARRPSDHGMRRRESELVLPPWQPDSDVTKCPVCQTQFSFMYRRHHCRKCGRVVCAACSPHRITIPRQYVVRNPLADQIDSVFIDGDEDRNPALGGGQVVRVCNPCVPDPWTPTSESSNRPTSTSTMTGFGDIPVEDWERAAMPPPPQPPHSTNLAPSRYRAQTYRYPAPRTPEGARSIRGEDIERLLASHFAQHVRRRGDNGDSGDDRPIIAHPGTRRHTHTSSGGGNTSTSAILASFHSRHPHHNHHHQHTPSSSDHFTHHQHRRLTSPPSSSAAATTASDPTLPPPPPRRIVREEDECPVCGIELPPNDSIREAHIEECIATRFSTSNNNNNNTNAINDPFNPNPTPPTGPPLQSPNSAAEGPATRPRATSYRPRGMAISRATEKDCADEEGEAVECVICFEEFKPGDELGRMECLCKFHRGCIRSWWETKGVGSCPTHQLHG